MTRKSVMHFPLSTGTYVQFVDYIISRAKQQVSVNVCTANVHMFIEAHRDKEFYKIIHETDVITPDGKPLTWALRLLYGIQQDRVAGMDLLPDLLEQAKIQQVPVYFYGGSPALLKQTELYVKKEYPGLVVAGVYSPPFRKLSAAEDADIIETINHSGAQLVFVVLGCPKQEKWMFAMKGKIHALMIGIGGALPVLAGLQKRAPGWMQRAGLEWLYRLLHEPVRLFKRYAVTNTLFLYLLIKEFLRLKVFNKRKFSF